MFSDGVPEGDHFPMKGTSHVAHYCNTGVFQLFLDASLSATFLFLLNEAFIHETARSS